jgi:hypothetical protein
MKKIKIDVPKGHKAQFDEANGEITFVKLPEDIKERVKTIDDAKAILGSDDLEVRILNILEKEMSTDNHVINYQRLVVIAKALNEGWQPDWQNCKWDKWYAWFEMGSSSGSGFAFDSADGRNAFSHAGSRLCFKSRELAEYAGKQFFENYKQFLILNNN